MKSTRQAQLEAISIVGSSVLFLFVILVSTMIAIL
jgi:hypothetical protein